MNFHSHEDLTCTTAAPTPTATTAPTPTAATTATTAAPIAAIRKKIMSTPALKTNAGDKKSSLKRSIECTVKGAKKKVITVEKSKSHKTTMNTIMSWINNVKETVSDTVAIAMAPRAVGEAYTEFVYKQQIISHEDFLVVLNLMKEHKKPSLETWATLNKIQQTIWWVIEKSETLVIEVDGDSFNDILLYKQMLMDFGTTEEALTYDYFLQEKAKALKIIKEELEVKRLRADLDASEKHIAQLREDLAVQKQKMEADMKEYKRIRKKMEKERKREAKKMDKMREEKSETICGFLGGDTYEAKRRRAYNKNVEDEWIALKLNREKRKKKGIMKNYGKEKPVKRRRQ